MGFARAPDDRGMARELKVSDHGRKQTRLLARASRTVSSARQTSYFPRYQGLLVARLARIDDRLTLRRPLDYCSISHGSYLPFLEHDESPCTP